MMPENKSHEVFTREETVSVGTEKGFGIAFSIVFAVVACGDIYFAKRLSNSAYFLFSASLFFHSLLTRHLSCFALLIKFGSVLAYFFMPL